MDPLAHTLVGASLAETRLGRGVAWAGLTAVVAANVPDIDAVTMFVDRDTSLGFRRGWTHGVLALAVLPLVVAWSVLWLDRAIARRRGRPARARPGPTIALCYVATLTHPALDWLNTYGIRLLMPFDGRWFYGDALFIIDPWLWLLAAASVALAHASTGRGRVSWMLLAVVTTALVIGVGGVPVVARVLWLVGIAGIVALTARGPARVAPATAATVCLAVATLYIALMVVGSRLAVRQVEAYLDARGQVPAEVMAGPLPANPFVRDVVVVDAEHYHFLSVRWLSDTRIRVAAPSVERGPRGPIVEAALRAPHVWGLATWTRYPAFEVETLPDGYRVIIRDMRYARRSGPSIGGAVVELDRDLRPRPVRD